MKKIAINIYKFKELEEEAKEKVIEEYIEFLIATTDFEKINKNSNLYKAYKKSTEMLTPWFLGSYIYDFCKKQIMQDINTQKYYENGEIFIEELEEE
mgnify:CR=1 FL=1